MLPAIACVARQHERAPRLEQYLFNLLSQMPKLHDACRTERDPHNNVGKDGSVDVGTNALTRQVLGDDQLVCHVRHEIVMFEARGNLAGPTREIADPIQATFRVLVPVTVELNPALVSNGVPRLRVDLDNQTVVRVRFQVDRHVAESGNQPRERPVVHVNARQMMKLNDTHSRIRPAFLVRSSYY